MKIDIQETCRLSAFYDLAKNAMMMAFFIIGAVFSNYLYHVIACYLGIICVVTYLMNAADFLYQSILDGEKRGWFYKYRRHIGHLLNLLSYFVFVSSVVLYLTTLIR